MTFPHAIQSFVGYLEGTQKSAHTIKNYRHDLHAFRDFIQNENPDKAVHLQEISRPDLERFRIFLQEKGLKTNTRRRKILTVTQFLNYLAKRKKLSPEVAQKIAAPHKIERIPATVPSAILLQRIQNLPQGSLIEARNRALLWTLAETGCLVSEVTDLRFDQWSPTPSGAKLEFLGKFQRTIPISADLFQTIQNLKTLCQEASWIFLGFNKFGSLGAPISSRGVELLVKAYGQKLGFKILTPRVIRHSTVFQWLKSGVAEEEIQARLGLKTTYAFRSFGPLLETGQSDFKSSSETTSTVETLPPES